MNRKIDDQDYLNYLLQSLNVKELKQICRENDIKGFSKLKKSELIDFIIDSFSEEEIKEVINKNEIEIITKEIDLAINKINGHDRELISSIKIVNPENHEVEIIFKGFNWENTSFLSITPENIDDPERDCDCRVGANSGFCSHFWAGFILSLKQDWFNLSNWTLTKLPDDFKEKIEMIKLTKMPTGGKTDEISENIVMTDESSEDNQFMEFVGKSITVYEGEISDLEKKEQDFQGNITVYYIITLKSAKLGPRVQKKSDFREEKIKSVEELNLRISEKIFDENDVKIGDNISGNGKLTRDNFLRIYIVKNIRKIQKIMEGI